MQCEKPKIIPPVRPVPEYVAKGELKDVYEDLKAQLGVPWVGVITQAIAYYESFFIEAWRQMRPSVQTNFFEEKCNQIRIKAWGGVLPHITKGEQYQKLKAIGYKDKEIAEMTEMLDVLDYGNPKYLCLATVIKDALINGGTLGRIPEQEHDLYPRMPVHAGTTKLLMVEEHHATGGLTEIYEDIKATLDLPFVNSDYKAQGRWPSYLTIAWDQLKPFIDTPEYNRLRNELNDMAYDLTRNLPYPYKLDKDFAKRLGMDQAEIVELIEVISLFQYLLSGLIIHVSFFKSSIQK